MLLGSVLASSVTTVGTTFQLNNPNGKTRLLTPNPLRVYMHVLVEASKTGQYQDLSGNVNLTAETFSTVNNGSNQIFSSVWTDPGAAGGVVNQTGYYEQQPSFMTATGTFTQGTSQLSIGGSSIAWLLIGSPSGLNVQTKWKPTSGIDLNTEGELTYPVHGPLTCCDLWFSATAVVPAATLRLQR